MSLFGRPQRAEERIPVGQAKVTIYGETYNVINWSHHGIMIGPYAGSLRPGQPFTFHFTLPMSDNEEFEFSA